MFVYSASIGPVDLAFTDRIGGVSAAPFDELNLAIGSADPRVPDNIELVRKAFGSTDTWIHLRQVHGSTVHIPEGHLVERSLLRAEESVAGVEKSLPEADAAVTTCTEVTLSVRAADCVPVLFADPTMGVIAAAHAGRAGMISGVVIETVREMRARGARDIQTWIGPHVCGTCYEVPAEMRDAVATELPEAVSETSWGTPALNLGAGVRAQLESLEVIVHDVSRCTLESPELYSYRRDGASAGRHVGIIRMRV